jgi:glutamate dehydrogenase
MADRSSPAAADKSVAATIAAAAALLGERTPKGFIEALFGRAVPEDLEPYAPREIAALAESAWSLLGVRSPGAAKMRFESPNETAGGDRLKDISVLEIVNDDMPFLVDSVMAELAERGLEVRLVVHPVFTVAREADGAMRQFDGSPAAGAGKESFIHIHVNRIEDRVERGLVVEALQQVCADVRHAVSDWRAMLDSIATIVAELRQSPTGARAPLPADELSEAALFLEWLAADNFTFLGIRHYRVSEEKDVLVLEPQFETGLGVLRERDMRVVRRGSQQVTITPEIRAFLNEPRFLFVTKAASRARVHRRVYMDYIGIRRFHADGRLAGEIRVVGLFTSSAYTRSTRSIPYLRRKVDGVLARAGFDPDGHSGKALVNVLETYPRDELFQIDGDTLYGFALAILQLEERPRVRVLSRRDRFDRFVSVFVFVPRDRYDSVVRQEIGDYLAGAYHGRVSAFYPFFPEGQMVRVHFIIGRQGGEAPDPSRPRLEAAVAGIVRTWTDGLIEMLQVFHAGDKAQTLIARYREAFTQGYREAYSPETAAADIRIIEGLSPSRPLGIDFHSRPSADGIGLKVWSHGRPIPLSERVPVLENMGFQVVDEQTFEITVAAEAKSAEEMYAAEAAPNVWFHDMVLKPLLAGEGREGVDLAAAKQRLEMTFLMVMRGGAESDGYNALVLTAGLMWREVALVRTISRFLRQLRVPYSQDYMWATLVKHARIAAEIVRLFHARFDPRIASTMDERAASEAEIASRIEESLRAVESLDEDRILRHFVNAVTAAERTNFYQIDANGQAKPTIAIKFASRRLDGMPLPKPLYEIMVYSPRLEAVHLRFGKVARGGIRWSDRPQDFRTEILGLVKAQQVKNAVIVPVGAKGGFVPKQLPKGPQTSLREAIQTEGTETYKLFMSTLLDLTDNLGAGVMPPANVVRHDGDDPYLVVAADKGTATFSDIANAIAGEHDFWLGDAFASGGSAGYDHKQMGITARGAWESVKRHFRELGIDIGKMPFTTVGIGDMSGDVFGNGMLRERTIKLVAAFDHRDIFLDPAPDLEKSFAERARLFGLPRSSWQDYDKSLISPGGGVFSRASKEIKLSAQARALVGLDAETVNPQQLISALIKMPVDLLWFGGIGTYVRASAETDDAVGDRANDAIRVSGADLKCKVIGEGANLGMTQRGRVEAALKGVRLNTDAIDNSAGVNTSDVEVNIKIAVAPVTRAGKLPLPARDALLTEMTEDVAALVLRNNYLQTLALSLELRRGLENLGFQQRLMQNLERRGELDRAVEFLPDDNELGERRRRAQGLTRPELAVLLAYAKLALYAELLESNVPDDPYLARELARYFPRALNERFPDAVAQHRLRREIIATSLANAIINRGGPAFAVRIEDQTGADAARIAAAFAAVRDSYDLVALNSAIDALDNIVPADLQLDLYAAVQDLLRDRLVWFLRNADFAGGLAAVAAHYREGIAAVAAVLANALAADAAAARTARERALIAQGLPAALALRFADLPGLTAAPDIITVADRTKRPIADVAATYFAAEAYFRLDGIVRAARALPVSDYFDRLALDRALDGIGDAERRLTAAMAQGAPGARGAGAVDAWVAPRRPEVERIRAQVTEIANSGLTLSKVSVVASLLGDLVR